MMERDHSSFVLFLVNGNLPLRVSLVYSRFSWVRHVPYF